MALRIGDRIGPYQILAPLGGGGMGEVYRARDTKLGRDVALKVLPESVAGDAERRARFHHEAQILAALSHPNIAAIYGLEDSSGVMALVMELVEGKPLGDCIRPRGMPLAQALGYAIQIVAGLEEAHKLGIVHRDLKPSNVMITASGSVKLVDFGLAKLLERAKAATNLSETETLVAKPKTEEGHILGTVFYMSPEQAQGKPVDGRSDLFSFGTMLYEMLTGARPFQGETQLSTLAAILQKDPKPPSELSAVLLPREVERLVLRCLRKEPDRRFQTAADLRLALEDLKEDSASGRLGAIASVAQRQTSRWLWAAVGIGVVVAAAAALWLSRQRTPAAPRLQELTFEAGAAFDPALSPDGRLLAYASDRGGRQVDIWLKQMAGGNPVRLTSGPESAMNPRFSPDGTRVYYLSGTEIFEIPALGGQSRKVIDNAGPFSVSSRGEIAFVRPQTGGAPSDMLIVPADGGAAEPWRPGCRSPVPPAWSPAGDQLLFLGNCNPPFFLVKLYRAARRGENMEELPVKGRPRLFDSIAWFRPLRGAEGAIFSLQGGDSVNLYRVTSDGEQKAVTFGTGVESSPVISTTGELIFTRSEQTPTIWSVGLQGTGSPTREAVSGHMFAVSADGRKLVYGRVLGTEKGQIVLRDRTTGQESVLASHDVAMGGIGSLWPQISPDGSRVIYRAFGSKARPAQFLVQTDGGQPRQLSDLDKFALASDWSRDGRRVLGECGPLGKMGICELDPASGQARELLRDDKGGELLYPSWSWDGGSVAFMKRRAGRTSICATPVRDGRLGGEESWVDIAPSGARPRFSADGASLFYEHANELLRQKLEPATKRPLGEPVSLAQIPSVFSRAAPINVVCVSRDRVFFNTYEVRSNVWMTRLE